MTGNGDNLTLNNSGQATLSGNEFNLGTLTASGIGNLVVGSPVISASAVSDSEATTFNGGTVYAATQDYKDPVTLEGATTFELNNTPTPATSVNFEQTLNEPAALTVDAVTTTFGGKVGYTTSLTSLTAEDTANEAAGTTAINGGVVKTSGAQTYNDPVTLGASTALTGTTLTFAGVAGGGNTLTLVNSGLVSGTGTVTPATLDTGRQRQCGFVWNAPEHGCRRHQFERDSARWRGQLAQQRKRCRERWRNHRQRWPEFDSRSGDGQRNIECRIGQRNL